MECIQRLIIYHNALMIHEDVTERSSLVEQMEFILYYSDRRHRNIAERSDPANDNSREALKFAGLCQALSFLPRSLQQIPWASCTDRRHPQQHTTSPETHMKVQMTNSILVYYSLEVYDPSLIAVIEVSRSQLTVPHKNRMTLNIEERLVSAHHQFRKRFNYNIHDVIAKVQKIKDDQRFEIDIDGDISVHQLKADLKTFYDTVIDQINIHAERGQE